MAEASVRDLRNHGGDLLDRVLAGERFTITRDGEPVAQLAPLARRRLSSATIVERFRSVPRMDPQRFRQDVDAVLDQAW